ncbi:DNA helicase RecQ [Treponema phagedenis]|nr:DNA helicase RecQ [Treponema phagedenis]
MFMVSPGVFHTNPFKIKPFMILFSTIIYEIHEGVSVQNAGAQDLLKRIFGHTEFRSRQEDIINAILAGNDTLAVMPTGAGKSLCYQIPAIMMSGVTLVVSPLISLMKDQVDALTENGVSAAYINSSLEYTEYCAILSGVRAGTFKLIYIAPERIENSFFLQLISEISVSMLVVDEAHCISQWGHDFRPSYRNIAAMVQTLKKRPIVSAFTATATKPVQEDIIKQLNLQNPFTVVTSFNRKNIFFSVVHNADKHEYLISNLNKNTSAIIYCATRKICEEVYSFLKKNNYPVSIYHAGLSEKERAQNQELFMYDKKPIMVATLAFGMGIDKSNVREVIHYNLPRSIENYYQEAGRCGRDGESAKATLLFSAQDKFINTFLIENSGGRQEEYDKLESMLAYAKTNHCLRKKLLAYFNEELAEDCGACSNCKAAFIEKDISIEAQKILSCVKRTNERFGSGLIADVLIGANTKRVKDFGFDSLSTYGIMKGETKRTVVRLIDELIAQECLVSSGYPRPILQLNRKSWAVLKGEKVFIKEHKAIRQEHKQLRPELLAELQTWRKLRAEKENVPPFIILSDASLHSLTALLPVTTEELLQVEGIGEFKNEKYGAELKTIITAYRNAYPDEKPILLNQKIKKPPKKKEKGAISETVMQSYSLYSQGLSIEQIAEERALSPQTIEKHICDCYEQGLAVDIYAFTTPEEETLILQAAEKTGSKYLRPIKDLLPESVSYLAIKLVCIKQKTVNSQINQSEVSQ